MAILRMAGLEFRPQNLLWEICRCVSPHILCIYLLHTYHTYNRTQLGRPLFFGWFQPKTLPPKNNASPRSLWQYVFFIPDSEAKSIMGIPKGIPCPGMSNPNPKQNTGWWFQPIWNILVKMGIFPGVKIKNDWNHHLENRFGLLRGGYMCSPFSARNVGETSLRFPSLFATMMSLVKGRYLRHSKNGHFRYPYLVFLGVVGSFTLKRMNISFQRLGKYI